MFRMYITFDVNNEKEYGRYQGKFWDIFEFFDTQTIEGSRKF
jgi:hypothetical protein